MSRAVRHMKRRHDSGQGQGTSSASIPSSWAEVQKLQGEGLSLVAVALGVTLTGNRRDDNSTIWKAIKAAA